MKYEDEIWDWNMKANQGLKYSGENWDTKAKSAFEIKKTKSDTEIWKRNLRLKYEGEIWYWNMKAKSEIEIWRQQLRLEYKAEISVDWGNYFSCSKSHNDGSFNKV